MSCSEGVSLVGGAKLTCVHGGETLQSQEEQLTVWSWGRAAVSRGLQPALSDTRTGPGLRGRWCRKSGTVHLSEPPGPLWQEVSLSLVHPCWGWGASLCESLLTKGSQVALVVRNPPANAGAARDAGLLPGWGRFPGGGIGNSLQYSCLENPMDRGAWQATIHEVAQSYTTERLGIYPMEEVCLVFLGPASLLKGVGLSLAYGP